MVRNIWNKLRLFITNVSLTDCLIGLYFFIIFLEPYLNGILGAINKYFIIVLIFIIFFKYRKFNITKLHIFFILWFIYKLISSLWSLNLEVVENNLFSHIGMSLLFIALTTVKFEKNIIKVISCSMWLGSFLIGFLSLFLSQPYKGFIDNRQVLVLFGQEADPNNQAALVLIGIAIASYYMFVKRKYFFISLTTLCVNIFSLFLTASRGGLIALIILFIFILFINISKTTFKEKFRFCIGILFIFVIIQFFTTYFLDKDILIRIFFFENYDDGSGRLDIWSNTFELISKDFNLVFGSGWGSYFGYNNYYISVHNTFISMLCDVGIIFFIMFFAPILYSSFRLIKEKKWLPVLVLIVSFATSFFIEAINKRFFWNAIYFLYICYFTDTTKSAKFLGGGLNEN